MSGLCRWRAQNGCGRLAWFPGCTDVFDFEGLFPDRGQSRWPSREPKLSRRLRSATSAGGGGRRRSHPPGAAEQRAPGLNLGSQARRKGVPAGLVRPPGGLAFRIVHWIHRVGPAPGRGRQPVKPSRRERPHGTRPGEWSGAAFPQGHFATHRRIQRRLVVARRSQVGGLGVGRSRRRDRRWLGDRWLQAPSEPQLSHRMDQSVCRPGPGGRQRHGREFGGDGILQQAGQTVVGSLFQVRAPVLIAAELRVGPAADQRNFLRAMETRHRTHPGQAHSCAWVPWYRYLLLAPRWENYLADQQNCLTVHQHGG